MDFPGWGNLSSGIPAQEDRPAWKTDHMGFPVLENMCKFIRKRIRKLMEIRAPGTVALTGRPQECRPQGVPPAGTPSAGTPSAGTPIAGWDA